MTKIHTVTMPDIGEGVVEGEVIRWLKQLHDPIAQDEPVVVVMTDKATVELPSPHPGRLAKQYYQPGENAIKDKPLYDIEVLENEDTKVSVEKADSAITPERVVSNSATATKPVKRTSGSHVAATPPVRKLARDLGIDLESLSGTGPEGRVTADDVKKSTTAQISSQDIAIPRFEDDEVRPLQGIRRLTARHVAQSKSTIPHFTYCDAADVTQLEELRNKLQPKAEAQRLRLTFTPFFLRALSLTLKQHPEFNGSFDSQTDALIVHRRHNIGIAMKSPLGLIVPVLKNVDSLSFENLVKAYHNLRRQALDGKLKPTDMKEATITLSNFGTEGGRWATPVISAPEVAILATAKIRSEAVVKNGQIVVRQILNCSWSFDHRVIDGDMAAAFSNTFIKLLENPIQVL